MRSRQVTHEEVLAQMTDLLSSYALKWFRGRHFVNWNQFVSTFLDTFEPSQKSDELLEFIRNKRQQPREPIIKFFAEMEDLFTRLQTIVPEMTRVKIIRNNLLPKYIRALTLFDFDNVDELNSFCRRIEQSEDSLAQRSGNNFIPTRPRNQDWHNTQPPRADNFGQRPWANSGTYQGYQRETQQTNRQYQRNPLGPNTRPQLPNSNIVPRNNRNTNTRPNFSSNGQSNLHVIDAQRYEEEEYYEDDYLYQYNPEYNGEGPSNAENSNGAALLGPSAAPNNPRSAQ